MPAVAVLRTRLADWARMQVLGYRATVAFGAEPDIRDWSNQVALNPARIPSHLRDDAGVSRCRAQVRSVRRAGDGSVGRDGGHAVVPSAPTRPPHTGPVTQDSGAPRRSRVRLVPLSEQHLALLREVAEDPQTQRFTRVPAHPPADFEREWLQMYVEGRRDGSREGFAIVDGSDDGVDGTAGVGELLGVALAPRVDRKARTVELGYIVAPAARGRGVATDALEQLTRWAFTTVGALRAELMISVANAGSRRVAERCGYVCEGVLRSVHLKQDIREDQEIWSRLPTD